MKPVLYGSLAARLARTPHIVNALAGLGHIFADRKRAGGLRAFVKLAFRWLLKGHTRVIVQNPDDLRLLLDVGAINPDQATLIRGSGVNLALFPQQAEPGGTPIVMLAARLLWDKGIREFVEAAKLLHKAGVSARCVVVGEPDSENHSSIPAEQMTAWHDTGEIEWWGKRTDMPTVLAQSHIVCLPSYYGEGVPKILLEAASIGRPIVTTDMPGCREAVTEGDNGLLVPARDAGALAAALKMLLNDPTRRKDMGQRGRERAEQEFSEEHVVSQTLDIYRLLLDTAH
jgi:glycosyltransferase involved in cell wall biosynthesis